MSCATSQPREGPRPRATAATVALGQLAAGHSRPQAPSSTRRRSCCLLSHPLTCQCPLPLHHGTTSADLPPPPGAACSSCPQARPKGQPEPAGGAEAASNPVPRGAAPGGRPRGDGAVPALTARRGYACTCPLHAHVHAPWHHPPPPEHK